MKNPKGKRMVVRTYKSPCAASKRAEKLGYSHIWLDKDGKWHVAKSALNIPEYAIVAATRL